VTTRRVYVYFAATFLLGVLAGGAGMLFYGWRMGPPKGEGVRERILDRMTRRLDLNPSQVEQIRAIMEHTGRRIDLLRRQHSPEYDAVRAEARDEMRKVLTPEQAVKFDEMVKKFEEHHKRLDQRRGPPPPPPPPPPEQ